MYARPMVEMKMVGLLLLIAMLVSACAVDGDDPIESPTTATSDPTSAPSAEATDGATEDAELPTEASTPEQDADPAPAAESGAESDRIGDATVKDGNPAETPDPEVPVPDLPAPNLEHPKEPNTEPMVPPPRD